MSRFQIKGGVGIVKLIRRYRFTILIFALLVLFSATLLIINLWTIRHISSRTSDTNATALAYIMQPIPEMMDSYFLYNIDAPMEAELSSTPFISYSFTTSRYPAGDALKERMQSDLQSLADGSEAVTGAFVYSATTDSFIYSPSLAESNSPFSDVDANIRDIIYNYNTGTLVHLPFYTGRHTTFKLQYHDTVLFTKDLTPASGIPASTLFVVVDMNRLASYLFRSEAFRPYSQVSIQVGMYDGNNAPFFTSKGLDTEAANEVLWRSTEGENVLKLGKSYGIAFTSGSLACRYVFIVGQDFLSPFTQGVSVLDLIYTNLLVTFVMIVVILLLIRRLTRPSEVRIAVLRNQLSLDEQGRDLLDYPDTFREISAEVSGLQNENEELKRILPHTAREAFQMTLFRMLSGGQADSRTLDAALRYSGFGFGIDDIYVAGVAAVRDCDVKDVERRYAVNTALNDALNQRMERDGFHCIAITLDAPFHALVLSFSQDTSIAVGKKAVNGLTARLTEALNRMGESAAIGFGHLYHSIYDLPFSFHEAMSQISLEPRPSREVSVDAGEAKTAPDAPAPEAGGSAPEDEAADTATLIHRRSSQIAELTHDGKDDAADKVLERALNEIVGNSEQGRWPDHCLHLVNGVTEAMMSGVFSVPDQITDVSHSLSAAIREGLSGDELIRRTREGVRVLCADMSRVLERQSSPYITAALEYIDGNYMNPALSLEEIAEQLKIAPNYLSSLFSKSLGRKLFDYVNEMRLKRSLELLLSTRDTVGEISEKSGFGSPRNYIRIFKKLMNTTPTAWRKQQLGKSDTQ